MSSLTVAALSHMPDHVPPRLVFDFDYFHDPSLARDIPHGMMPLRGNAPDVFSTPCNGGHWVVTRMTELRAVMTRPKLFSSNSSPPTTNEAPKVPLSPQNMDAPTTWDIACCC